MRVPLPELLGQVPVIEDPSRWGFVFRRGLFEIGAEGFRRSAWAMKAVEGRADLGAE